MEQADIREATSSRDFAEAKILIGEYAGALGVDLRFQSIAQEMSGLEKVYGPPRGCLLVARYKLELAGCVAIRSKGDTVCEMKRLYVRPPYRGMGLGRQLTEAVIEHARQLGYLQIFLDTCRP